MTDRIPVANTELAKSFFLNGNLSLKMPNTGMMRIERCERMFSGAVADMEATSLIQWPSIIGCQDFSRGVHPKMEASIKEMYRSRLTQIRTFMMRRKGFLRSCAKKVALICCNKTYLIGNTVVEYIILAIYLGCSHHYN